ncbi:MAG: FAD-dependent oxidoreductase [Gemmatimonadales bacterium]
MKPNVVVIGAGINGLVTSHYLRRAGCAVTLLERADRVGGACVSEVATVHGHSQRYALGASVLGLMPDFIFRETGLAERLETFVPTHAKRVYFPSPDASAWIHRDARELDRELRARWGERGDATAFRADEARVVGFLQEGYRTATTPSLAAAREQLGDTLTRLWITGSAVDLLQHYFTAERTRIYMAMTVTESGPVSLHEPYSAFTLPVMDSGSVFEGYYGFVKPGIWRVTEALAEINRAIGVDLQLGAQVERVDPERGVVHYLSGGRTRALPFDHLVMASDPLVAARLVGDAAMTADIEGKRFLGTSGKLTLLFQHPVRWKEGSAAAGGDAAFRFVFAVESLAEFERATLRVISGEVDYEPGFIQIYCEGAAMRQLGLAEPFDRLTLFFKNVALNRNGEAMPEVEASVKAQVFAHLANPEDCVWSRLLLPRDLQQLFLFPGGNLDHTMLVGGQTFFERQYAADPGQAFYQFGRWANLSYCGAGAYPCGSIAGTPGYMCAQQLIRALALTPGV